MNHPWRRNLVNRLKAVRSHAGLAGQAASLPRWFEPLEPRVLLSGSISGQVFSDANANGTKDAGEGTISGVTIYIDANNDGQLDNGEANIVTDTSGNYSFTGLAAGTSTIAEVLVSNAVALSTPSTGSYSITLSANQTVTGKNFGDYVKATIQREYFRRSERQRPCRRPGSRHRGCDSLFRQEQERDARPWRGLDDHRRQRKLHARACARRVRHAPRQPSRG